jgi:hypothetical protein
MAPAAPAKSELLDVAIAMPAAAIEPLNVPPAFETLFASPGGSFEALPRMIYC